MHKLQIKKTKKPVEYSVKTGHLLFIIVGILPESKNEWERRTPLTPKDVSWLVKRKIPVGVASSPLRI